MKIFNFLLIVFVLLNVSFVQSKRWFLRPVKDIIPNEVEQTFTENVIDVNVQETSTEKINVVENVNNGIIRVPPTENCPDGFRKDVLGKCRKIWFD